MVAQLTALQDLELMWRGSLAGGRLPLTRLTQLTCLEAWSLDAGAGSSFSALVSDAPMLPWPACSAEALRHWLHACAASTRVHSMGHILQSRRGCCCVSCRPHWPATPLCGQSCCRGASDLAHPRRCRQHNRRLPCLRTDDDAVGVSAAAMHDTLLQCCCCRISLVAGHA